MNKILPFLMLLAAIPAFAQTGAVQGYCDLGGSKAVTSGSSSTNYLQGVIPSCTVTVYLTGTTTKATIYADKLSTPLANPFTANAAAPTVAGQWIFWAGTNQGLDIVLSGGIAPNTFPSPVTVLRDVYGSSSVTPVAGVSEVDTDTTTGILGGPITGTGTIACLPGTSTQFGCVKVDGTTVTSVGGVISASAAGGVTSIIAGTGISVDSPTGAVTVTNTGSFNPPTTNYVWVGDSRLFVTTYNQVTATALSSDGTTITVTLPNVAANWVDNAALAPGDTIQFFAHTAWSPTCVAWGNATVLTASATQVTVAQNSLGPVTCTGSLSGTGGVIQKANYFIPELTGSEPYFNGHGTTYNMGVAAQTVAGLATQYTAYIHPLSPAVTGHYPSYLFIQTGSQNALNCDSAATIETGLQNYWATAHADGWTVVMTTLITTGPTISCQSEAYINAVNYWLRSQVKGYDQTLTTANKYWDLLVDVAEYVGDINDQNIFNTGSESLHLNNGGTKTISALMNLAMVAKGTIPPNPRTGSSVGSRTVDVTGSFGAGRGFRTFSQESWNGNTTSGDFSVGIDHAATGPTASVGAFWLPNSVASSEDLAAGYALSGNQPVWLAPSTGGYCWKNGTGGAFLSQQGTDSCFKRIAANEVAFGDGSSSTDFSGQLDFTSLKMTATAPSGACAAGLGGVWRLTQDGAITYCPSGGGTWTTFAAGGGGLSGMTTGQVPIAATASTVTSSKAIQGTDTSLLSSGTVSGTAALLCTDANGGATTSGCPSAGSGTVTVVGAGTLTSTALVTGGGSQTVQTPSATSTLDSSGNMAIAGTMTVGGANGNILLTEGTPSGATAGKDLLSADTTTHRLVQNANNAGQVIISGTAAARTAGNCVSWATNGIDLVDAGGACGVAGGGAAFSAITTGSNTTATMTVGSGGSLVRSGTGIVDANQVNSATVPASQTFVGTNSSSQIVAATLPISFGFTLNTGAAASPAVPFITAPRAGSITTCYWTTTTSHASTDLIMNIKKSAGAGAGTSILSGSSATITHGATAKAQQSLTLTGTITVSALDEYELDVTTGDSAWTGSIVCY